jgi:hypothetical protein
MSENEKQNKSEFKVLRSAEPLKLGNNTFYNSVQEIKQENGSTSEHLVIKKQKSNLDGSPQGASKQVWIPIANADEVLKKAHDLVKAK